MDQFSSEKQSLLAQVTASVRLPISGMTCQSCVRNIESNIRTKPGIVAIKVNLQEKAGYIDYDPHITDPNQIANEIDDMGFDCVHDAGDADDDDEHIAANIVNSNRSSSIQTARISIDGMHCQSCVKNIESNIGNERGVHRITVNLEEKMATVEYESELCTPANIAEKIGDMGFTAAVINENGNSMLEPTKGICLISIHIFESLNEF